MQGPRWERIQELFHAALELPDSQRMAYLNAEAGDDPELIREVSELITADSVGSKLIDDGVAGAAGTLLGEQRPIIGRRIGSYRIVRLLGEGGMGVVYLAEREDLARSVAIKLLRDAGLSPARRALFTAEQRTLAQLTHPAISRLYDADLSADGIPYIVMEFVEGEPLTAYCERHGSDLPTRVRLFRAVCEAVQYAHQHAVIHRDLKPSNILVRADGTPTLLDFGIAKHLANGGEAELQTRSTMMTPRYAAPEQLTGGVVGVQTDVYALGIILYELLTGLTPFEVDGRTPAQVERMVTASPPPRPSTRNRTPAELPTGELPSADAASWSELDTLCLAALHRDPEQRYASVEALIRDLDHYLRSEPLEARPESMVYRLRMFVRRHRLSTVSAALTVALIVALATFFTLRLQNEHAAALQQAARAQRIQSFVTSLVQGGDAEAGPEENLKVITLLDRGVYEVAGLKDEPMTQADMYETLGALYQNLGRLDRADTLLTDALALRRSHSKPGDAGYVGGLDALASLRLAQGKLPESESLAREALAVARTHPSASADMGRALVTLGRAQAEQGHYEDAIDTLQEAVTRASAHGAQAADMGASLRALAAAQYSAGHYDISNSLYERLLALDRQEHGANHPTVADDLSSLGSIQQDLGYYAAAESFSRDSLRIITAYYGEQHPKTASGLTMLGRALLFQNNYEPAEEALERALAIEEHAYGQVHTSIADTLNEMGNLASMCDDYATAQLRFARVADIYRSIYGDHHYLVAIALSNVAYNKLNQKDYAGAQSGFQDVVRRFTETLGADNINTGIAQIKLGRALLKQNLFGEAEDHTRAGYENLIHQANPGVSFLQAARKDLASEYEALGQPLLAQRFHAESAQHDSSP